MKGLTCILICLMLYLSASLSPMCMHVFVKITKHNPLNCLYISTSICQHLHMYKTHRIDNNTPHQHYLPAMDDYRRIRFIS